MEKLDVRASEVPVRHAIDQIVETGFGEGEPGQVVQDTWAYRFERVEAHDYAERQPEHDKHDAAVYVGLGELVVPGECDRWLVRAPCGVADADHELHVEEYGRQGWQPYQERGAYYLLHRYTGETSPAKVGTYVQGRLQHHCHGGYQPDAYDRRCDAAWGQHAVSVSGIYMMKTKIFERGSDFKVV